MLSDLIKSGKTVALVGILKQPKYMLETIDILPDLVSKDFLFEDFENCLNWIKNKH